MCRQGEAVRSGEEAAPQLEPQKRRPHMYYIYTAAQAAAHLAEKVVVRIEVQRVAKVAVAQPKVEVVEPQPLHPRHWRVKVAQQPTHWPQRRLP